MAAAAFHWNVDPILVQFGPIAVHWYGLFFAGAFVVGYAIAERMFKREGKDPALLDRLLTYMLIGTIIGARLGHVLFYDPDYYFAHPAEILQVWKGGLASHGAAVGILISLYLAARKSRLSYLWLLDRVVIPTALGGAFIRVGNFFNSEIVGTPTSGWWAVVFDRVDPLPRHPVQLYEAIAYLLIFLVLLLVYRQHSARPPDGLILGLFLVLVFAARFVIEFAKTPQASYEAGFVLSVGQMLSVPFVIAGIVLILRARRLPD
jgi:prolipoprotein diacylglyceryl transferase